MCNNSIIVSNDMKRTEKDLHISPFCHNFAPKYKKNSSQMLQLSKIMLIFVPSFGKRRRHRGERLSFDPPENLQNSKYKGEKSESCFSCSSIYTALSCVELARIYPCRCELISFLLIRVLQNLLAKDARRLTLFVHRNN